MNNPNQHNPTLNTQHSTLNNPLPFSAFVGYTAAQRALMCVLIDRSLGGVILSGASGTGKSALLRSFRAFVHDEVDPESPMVELPLGVTEDRLIGGIDLDIALATGERRIRRGLIAEADHGFLFAHDCSLLDKQSLFAITHALESGKSVCEREGLSLVSPADIVLLATVVPAERELSRSVADRIAFLIAPETRLREDLLLTLLARMEEFRRTPEVVTAEFAKYNRRFAESVTSARMIHRLISVHEELLGYLDSTAEKFGVEGTRASLFAAKAARAHAALRGSRMIEQQDISFAIATVIVPRALRIPLDTDDEHPPQNEEQRQTNQPLPDEAERMEDSDQKKESNRQEGSGEAAEQYEGAMEHEGDLPTNDGGSEMYDPLDFDAPLPELGAFTAFTPQPQEHSGGGDPEEQWKRGRHVRSVQAKPTGKRIAVGATLRAAAVHQKQRRKPGEQRVIVRASDIHVRKFTQRTGTLYIFCVDASGSMASNRMREAKGAVTRLLQNAYIERDTVALIIFRGTDAEVVLPPTNSVERAKRSMDRTPTGGGTPLASALLKAYHIAERAKHTGTRNTLIVLLTDGRANVPMTGNPADMIASVRRKHVREELEHLATLYRRTKLPSIVIDTRNTYNEGSEAAQLAELLNGRYYYLPLIRADGIVKAVKPS